MYECFHYEIRDFQLHLLEVLDALDAVCREHGLTYYLLGGTLLGSVRSGGFIPWDDDVDVGMMRADYDTLMEHAQEWLPARYAMVSYKTNPDVSRHFAKLEDRNTTLVERFHLKKVGGVYVDIFPLDAVPDNAFRRRIHVTRFKYVERLLYYAYRDPYKHGKGLSAAFYKLFQRCVSRERLHERLQRVVKEFNGHKNCSGVVTHSSFKPVPFEAYGTPALYRFENKEYYGPAQAEPYLSINYGKDYIVPPPPEKRETHYFQYCDLDHGYEAADFDKLKALYKQYLEQKKEAQ